MKVCKTCKLEKELNEFYKDKKLISGYFSSCKTCKKEYHKAYHIANAEKILKRKKEQNKVKEVIIYLKELTPNFSYVQIEL